MQDIQDEEQPAAGTLIEEDILGIEVFKQKSVGIDIGSSTSHLIFSELTLRREGFSSRFRVAEREVLFQSPILLTPYITGTQIDSQALHAFVAKSYQSAGVTPEDIDAGAVVVTGEALKKENAQPIAEMFSREVGKFICVSAGPNHEALLAAYGSGAAALSADNHWKVLNVDIGGGTTKFSYIDDGDVLETVAIEIGARLIAFDESGSITRIEGPAQIILGSDGELKLGNEATPELRTLLADRMIESLLDIILARPFSERTQSLMNLTPPFSTYPGPKSIDAIVFSGGVSEYVYGRDEVAYGDLGPLLGRGIRQKLEDAGHANLIKSSPSGIRATVIGAGEYTIQASGTTSFLSTRDLLPVYAMQVVKAEPTGNETLREAAIRSLRKFDKTEYGEGLVVALKIGESLNYPYLRGLAEGVFSIVETAHDRIECLFLVLDKDVAKTIGSILKEELGFKPHVIAIDGIDLGDLDFIDIGRPMGTSEVLPVTVKSLIFPTRSHA
jgi:ethanolamine utilization protein EutA